MAIIAAGLAFMIVTALSAIAGRMVVANEENAMHSQPAVTWGDYMVSPDFWDRTLQNWQSEFLAVGAMVAFSIYLRQRGSSESKPVGLPHRVAAEESE